VLVLKRRFLLIVFCVVVLVVLFAVAFLRPIPLMVDTSAPVSLQDESLRFLRDVIGFNMTRYGVVDSHFVPQVDVVNRNGLRLYLMKYDLTSLDDQAYVEMFYTKVGDDYLPEPYFSVYSSALFSPAYPTDKVLNWTKSFLDRYQNYQTNASYLLEMKQTLNLVDHIQPLNLTSGGITLQIEIKQFTEQDIYTTLKLAPSNSTVHDLDNAVTFEFHNGALLHFSDYCETSNY
jgi:hypothetical protein